MTTVNDFVDILRIIREQPEWGEALRSALLSKEVLELPQRLAEFSEAANRKFDRLEGDAVELKEGQARPEGDVAGLKEGQARLEGDVAGLKEGQARLEGEVAGLKEGQTRLERSVGRLEGQVGNLRGNFYEQRIGDTISSIMSDRIDIRVRALKRANLDDDSEFFDLIHGAEGRGAISSRERSDLAKADIVLQERGRPDAATCYIVVDVSTTLADHDVIRSAERAAIMQRATDGTALPLVVCAYVDEARERLAEELNVTLVIVGD